MFARASVLALLSLCLTAAGCAAPSAEDGVGADESELRDRIPLGTYVLRYGPSGTLSSPLVRQRHVTRLTVLARNAFEADVLTEAAQTKVNPLFPWLTYQSVEKTKMLERGTMKFGSDAKGATVTIGDVGTFHYAIADKDLTLTATDYNNERRTELRLDASYQPDAPAAAITLKCVHRYVDRGSSIEITLDKDDNQAGKAVVKLASDRGEWPAAGTYDLAIDDYLSNAQWRKFDAKKGGRKAMTFNLPVAALAKGTGSFDAGGGYYKGDDLFGGEYNLSLRCTHE